MPSSETETIHRKLSNGNIIRTVALSVHIVQEVAAGF